MSKAGGGNMILRFAAVAAAAVLAILGASAFVLYWTVGRFIGVITGL